MTAITANEARTAPTAPTGHAAPRPTADAHDGVPPVDAELERLWARYTERHEVDDRNRLVLTYAPLVKFVAGRLASRMSAAVELDDLMSYGMLGLIEAIERYDTDRGHQFSTYACHRIRGSIIDELRRLDWVPRRLRAELRRLDETREELAQELGREPEGDEIAARLERADTSSRTVMKVVSLDEDENDDGTARVSQIGEDDPYFGRIDDTLLVASLLRRLRPRDRFVLEAHYLENRALADIGEELGISESRVSQLLSRARTTLANLAAVSLGQAS